MQEPPSDQVNIIHRQVVDAVTRASPEVIPERKKECETKPWVNDEFLGLIVKCNQSCDPEEKKEISKRIRKMRIALKNMYFREKAHKMNVASVQRNVEEKCCLSKTYSSLSRKNMKVIDQQK